MTSGTNLIQLSLQRPGFNLQVDLTLPARGITVLSGPSGSGKTTLLRCVAGLERPQQALVRIAGQVWQHSQPGLFVPTWRRPLGYVFQEASLFDHLNVLANLRYGLQRSPLRAQSTTLDAAVTLLGIGALLQRHPHQLSGGERQRVAIARALAMQPQLLLLDEPLAALDYARRQEILPWIERLRDELHIPMLYVTHAADEVARLADTLVAMNRGRVVAAGPAPEVFARIETPVVLGDDLGALLTGVVQERDAKWHLMRVQCEGLSLWLRDSGATVGHKVRLRVLARDVSLATEMPQHSSIQNILHCVVQTVLPDAHPSQTLLRVACGPAVLVARVTARAVDALQLVPGKTVWAQVKSVALIE